MLHIGLVGEFNQEARSHVAIPHALEYAAQDLAAFEAQWLSTMTLEENPEQMLADFDALWFVPNTPYESMEGALKAIRFAREKRVPALGTCGGCQHMIIEYARNVLGMVEADHAESNPEATIQLITPLVCTRTGLVTECLLAPGSQAARIYDATEVTEQYGSCNYGPNAQFWPQLEQGGMHISGRDTEGDARIIELGQHPFFIGTLFQPELSAYQQVTHPLIKAFVQAAALGQSM